MPEINNEIIDGIKKVGEKVQHIQEVNDRLEKQYDGLDVENIKKNSAQVAKLYEDIQKLNMKANAQKEAEDNYIKRIETLESEIAHKGDLITGDSENILDRYKKEANSYFRTGRALSYDLIEIIAKRQTEKVLKFGGEKDFETYRDKFIDNMRGVKALTVGVAPEAGYFVLPERSDVIIERIFETSPVRNYAMGYSTDSDLFQIVRDTGEFDAGWVGEIQTRPDTDTNELSLLEIPIHEVYAQPKLSQKMIDDAGLDIEAWMNTKVSRKFSRKENTSWVLGTGNKQPKGFLSYPNWTTPGVFQTDAVEQILATGTAGTLDNADDLINLQESLHEGYQADAVWGMNRKTFGDVISLKDEQGQYLINATLLRDGADKVLLGNPIVFMADMPDVAADAYPVVYASFTDFYAIVDRYGIRVLRDMLTDKPYTKIYTTKRVGGAVQNEEAGKILKINA
jgi:HK97 family phage major capsid protein